MAIKDRKYHQQLLMITCWYCIDQKMLRNGYDHIIVVYWSNIISIWLWSNDLRVL